MADNDPISYLALAKGTRVQSSSDEQFGVVEHVLQDSSLDLFDGLVVKTQHGLRFVGADRIADIRVGAVHTTLTNEDAAALPAPDGDAVLEADPDEYDGNGLSAWFGKMFLREHWMRERNED